MAGGEALVRGLWGAYEARDWAAARGLLANDARCTWWTSGERFVGGDAVIRLNAVYPEGWHIEVLAVEALADGRVLSLVRVDQGDSTYYAHSWFTFSASGPLRIAAIDEFWATFEQPPAWRESLAGRERLPAGASWVPLKA